MKTLSLQHSRLHRPSLADSPTPIPRVRVTSLLSPKAGAFPRTTALSTTARTPQPAETSSRHEEATDDCKHAVPAHEGRSRALIVGAVTVGVAAFLIGADDGHHSVALAFGPEGPLVEEFWDNVRRYGLYALTVSTGAIYTIVQPIIELLKNPISAVLIILILGGSFYIMSQVLSAMIGITEFSYEYQY